MPTRTLGPRPDIGRYRPPLPGTTESERVLAYRHRRAVVRHLEQLIAAGKIDQAMSYALPVLALVETAPALAPLMELLRELDLVDAREDVSRALFRRDPVAHRASYLAHLRQTVQGMMATIRRLELEGDA